MNDNITMYDYILEEEEILMRLLQQREALTAGFCALLQDKKPQEIILCGSGTSYHAALAARRLIETLTGIRTRAELPSLFVHEQQIYSPQSLMIGISQGGNSLSTAQALRKARQAGCLTAALSENQQALIFTFSDLHLLMECGPELSIAKTKGYTVSVLILWLLGIEGALAIGRIDPHQHQTLIRRLHTTIHNFSAIIPAATRWTDAMTDELIEGRRILVLGYGHNYANVLEGALKMLETMRFAITGYDLEEFCHGIYNSVHPDTRLIYLASPDPALRRRLLQIRSVIADTTSHQSVIGSAFAGFDPEPNDCVLPLIDDPDFHVLEYILPLQIVASRLPYRLGIDPFYAADPHFHQRAGSKQTG